MSVANAGAIRPPVVYLAAIVIGLAVELRWPLGFAGGRAFGAVLIVIAATLFLCSTAAFRAAGTPVPGNRPTTAIVSTGPYRFSRNPIYLAFSLLQLGIAAWIDSLWLVATLVAALALMTNVVIPREERYLEARFGAGYRDYKARVRRWI